MKSAKINPPYKWKFDDQSSMLDIQQWCRQHFGTAYLQLYGYLADFEQELRWTYSDRIFYFHHEEDYAWFLLKWVK